MAEQSEFRCGPCESRNLSNNALLWCSVCEEGLCTECSEYHKVSKSSRQHSTLPIQNYQDLPEFFRTLSKTCLLHGEPLVLYCGTHQEPGCAECIAFQHTKCIGVTLLSQTVKGIKESEYISGTKRQIRGLKTSMEEMKQNRHANIDRLQQQRFSICEEITRYRDTVNKQLDIIEAKIQKELLETVASESKKCKKAEEILEGQLSKIVDLEKSISKIENYGNEEHVFLGMTYLKNCLLTEEQELKLNTKQDDFQEKHIDLVLTEEMKIFRNIFCMGNIKLSNKPNPVLYIETKQVTAQMFSSSVINSLEIKVTSIKKGPTFHRFYEDEVVNIRSLIQLPDGRIVLAIADENESKGYIDVFDSNGSIITRKKHISCPFGISWINNKLLVSSNKAKILATLDSKTFSLGSTVLKGSIYGLSCDGDTLAIAVRGKGIVLADKEGTPIKTITTIINSHLAYIHLCKNKLFYTDYNDNYLYCLDLNGEELWKSTFEEIKGPRNICTDESGNIFVAATESNAVYVISADGSKFMKLLGQDDGMSEPKAIYFNQLNSELIVANKRGNFFICSLQFQ
ncbi:uncharacterized protein LOC127702965 [Mytilus californianus]|uniref:uncharacterized protein LOC127702965 n=1 Tax=Mytilus californianus TaxID=6549 RepID=UPI00224503EC|nr:uncharacterized protein LOC127702965 [Mytilus californianus]